MVTGVMETNANRKRDARPGEGGRGGKDGERKREPEGLLGRDGVVEKERDKEGMKGKTTRAR